MTTIYLALNDAAALGGIQRVAATLEREFAARGFTVRVISLRRPPGPRSADVIVPFPRIPLPRRLERWLNRGGMRVERANAYGQRAAVRAIQRQLAAEPGIVIAMDVFMAQLLARVPEDPRSPRILQYHNAFATIEGTRDDPRLRAASAHFDVFTALSDVDAGLFRSVLGCRVVALPNPVPFTRTTDRSAAEDVLLYVGRLDEGKGLERLLHSWATLTSGQRSGWRLQIVGDGSLRAQLERIVDEKGLTDSVEMLGRREDIPVLLSRAGALVLPSDYEGLPMALLEAMSMSVPCIATESSPGVRELVGGGAGILIPLQDQQALTDSIRSLIDSAALRRRLSAAGYERAARYQPDVVMAQWEELFANLR